MPLTPAARQARYRERQKARAGESLEQAIERLRQEQLDEFIKQTADDARMCGCEPDEAETMMLADFRAEPPRTGDDFERWLAQLLWDDLDYSIRAYRKEWRRKARAKRRRA